MSRDFELDILDEKGYHIVIDNMLSLNCEPSHQKDTFMKYRDRFLRKIPQTAIVLLLLFCTVSIAPAQTTLPAEDIAEKALAATVYLEMKDTNGKTLGIGSGFFVKPNIIATNYHVIEGAAKGTAKLVGKNTTYNIEGVTATDKDNDLILLKVTADDIKPLILGDSHKIRNKEKVYVAGNPKGLEGMFSDGIVHNRLNKGTKERLQIDTSVLFLSSGGPVLNRKGEVIGVSVAVHRSLDVQSPNFAIPSKYLKQLLTQSKPEEPLLKAVQSISADTYILWGNAKYNTGDYADAIADYYMVIQLKPDDADAYNNMGLAKYHLDKYFDAIADFDTAIKLKPDYVHAYINRGIAKTGLRQVAAAISDFDIAIRLKPDLAKAYYNRGLLKALLEHFAAAISDFDTAIRLEPDFASTYVNRGVVKRKLGQYAAAISDYDIAIRLEPNAADVYLNRGAAKESLGQHLAAISDFDTAIRLKPDYAKAYYNRGVSKVRLGHKSKAHRDFQIVLRLAIKAGDTGLKISAEKALQRLSE